MKYAVVTTMHRGGLAQYGEAFLTSFQANWPAGVELLCFTEGWDARHLPAGEYPSVKLLDLEMECPDMVAFKLRHCNNIAAQGMDAQGKAYNYRMDAVRFCHKVFALARALEIVQQDPEIERLIWLDADVLTHRPMPMEFLDSLLPGSRDIGYLRRDKMFEYPECGFVIYNVKRDPAPTLIRMMRELWRLDHVFGLPEWHDSFVFNVILLGMIDNNMIRVRSLSGGHEEHEHPFINGPLGQYMDHLKGPLRKRAGASLAEDVLPGRTEEYWRGLAAKAQPGAEVVYRNQAGEEIDGNTEVPGPAAAAE